LQIEKFGNSAIAGEWEEAAGWHAAGKTDNGSHEAVVAWRLVTTTVLTTRQRKNMAAHLRIELPDNPADELAPISDREQTAALRREVGRCARSAWDALQRTLSAFSRAKAGATERLMVETGHACDVALSELDRLEQALRSLRAELAAVQRSARASQTTTLRNSFLDALVDRSMSQPP
jgi:hypothetical protein